MLKNYVRAEYRTVFERELVFLHEGGQSGSAFPCDEKGNVLPLKYEEAKQNLAWCMAHPEKFETYAKVVTNRRSVREPAHGTCSCGREVELYDQYYGACSCECGRWYNLFGQELVAPQYWETDPSEEEYWN